MVNCRWRWAGAELLMDELPNSHIWLRVRTLPSRKELSSANIDAIFSIQARRPIEAFHFFGKRYDTLQIDKTNCEIEATYISAIVYSFAIL